MPQDFAHYDEPGDPWHIGGRLNKIYIQSLWDLTITWDSGGTDTIAALKPAQVIDGTDTDIFVDLTSGVYMIVAKKGESIPYLAKEADYNNLDTLTSSATWAVLRRWITSKTLDWQQS